MLFVALAIAAPVTVSAAPKPTPSPAATASPDYAKFTATATSQPGLFTIWRSKNNVALELRADQFDKDFIEVGVPTNGVGEGLFSGITDLQPARIIRFHRQDDKVAILFPATVFSAAPGSPEARAVEAGTAPTVVGIAKVLTENTATGSVVFDATPFLDDVTGVADALTALNGGPLNPRGSYRLDSQKTYFGQSKAFPDNIIIDVDQTFASSSSIASDALSVVPDARSLQLRIQYNIAAIPPNDGYVPRLYDDRVGYFSNAHLDFSKDNVFDKSLNYIIRWNIQPSDPTKAMSPAKIPVVYYLSNTIPYKYRAPIRRALLRWNDAFARIGISNAVVVKDQPDDPNFDPDDVRYNVIRWVTETNGGFAEAQFMYNPYTGEMFKSGVVIDSDLMRFSNFAEYVELPHASVSRLGNGKGDNNYLENAQLNFGFGAMALTGFGGSYNLPQKYVDEFLESVVLHESGHAFGLRHNFIGSEAYTAKELQSKTFTSRNGVASSVMEYAPTNIWPKGTPQGDFYQTVLGPYDYYVIKWGYARIPGANSSSAELPTLRRWAGAWSQARYAYSSDEDVSWADGVAIDPRNQQWDLSNDNISWCRAQMTIARQLMGSVSSRFPSAQAPYDDLRTAFGISIGAYGRCAMIVSRYVGGEYVSRSLRGDPNAKPPLSPIPLATQKRALSMLDDQLFSAHAWEVSPSVLRQLVTQYRYDDFLGNLVPRHDMPLEDIVARYQLATISRFFQPITLSRLDDMDMKYGSHTTMDIADLFTWMQNTVYGDVRPGRAIPLLRRNLQRNYAGLLARMANTPMRGAPSDAQALARLELRSLHASLQSALAGGVPDLLTRAHLESLDTDVLRALNAQQLIFPSLSLTVGG
jgi:hypothetical protein